MKHLEIRPKCDPDEPALEEIFRLNRGPDVVWLNPHQPPDSLAAQSEGEMILPASREQQVIGFISVWEPDRFIHHLYVHPDHQGTGIGKALIDAVAQRYPGPLTLKCVAANHAALAFYRHTGWHQISTGTGPDGDYFLLQRPG